MKIKVIFALILLFSVFVYAQESTDVEFNAGILPSNPLYFVDKAIDDIRVDLANEEQKALVAIEVHNERIAEAEALIETEEIKAEHVEEAISEAEENIKIVQEEITPEVNEEVKDSTKISVEVLTELKEKVTEEAFPGIENALDKQIVEEKKTEIVAEITSKIDKLCTQLIELVGLEEAIAQEPRCDPNFVNSPKWLKRKVNTDYKEFDENAKRKFFEEMSICFNDPRECRCGEIPITSFSNTCHKIIPHVIKCQFEHDENACQRVEEISRESEGGMFEELPEDFRVELEEFFRTKERETFEKHFPRECKEAGLTTREECMKLMIDKYMPQECKDAGVTTREACERIMREKYGGQRFDTPHECLRDGRFIGVEECERIMFDKYLPRECKEAQAFTKEGCEAIMISKYAPPECLYENGKFVGKERCEEIIKLKHQITNGINQRSFNTEEFMQSCLREGKSREECEIIIRNKFAQEFPQPLEKAREVVSNLENNPQVQNVINNFDRIESNLQNVPQECVGLTKEDCANKLGISYTPEVPSGVIFKEGEAIPITDQEIQNIVTVSGSNIQEINIGEFREEILRDVETLEAGIETLEQAPVEEAATAVEATTQETIIVSGSAVFDVLKLLERLGK